MRSTATRFLGPLWWYIYFFFHFNFRTLFALRSATTISGSFWSFFLYHFLFEHSLPALCTIAWQSCTSELTLALGMCVYEGGVGGIPGMNTVTWRAQISITLSSVNWKKATVPSRPRSGVGNKLQETRCIGGLRKWKGKGAAQGNTSNQLATLAWFLCTTPR